MTEEIGYYSNMSQVANMSQLLNIGTLEYYINNSVDLTNMLDYYTNLLIIQYHDLPKAKATIQALCNILTPINSVTGNLLINDIRDAFNIDTAIGVQLDIIGEYVGVDRLWQGLNLSGNYFVFVDEDSSIPVGFENLGYIDFNDITVGGSWLDENSLLSVTNKLNDDDYRKLIKLKILQNTSNHSWASLVNGLYTIFGNSVYIGTSGGGTMAYYYSTVQLPPLIQAMAAKKILPRPMGIIISGLVPPLTEGSAYFGFWDLQSDITDAPITGYTDFDDVTVSGGSWLLEENML